MSTTAIDNMDHTEYPSKFKAVMTARCPECRKGPLFSHSPFHYSKFQAVHKECPHCKCNYEPEPGFFWGALYINYGFNVATLVAVSLALWVLFGGVDVWTHIIAVVVTVIVTIPFTTRISRNLMMHWFGPYHFRPELHDNGVDARSEDEMRKLDKARKERARIRNHAR